MFKKILLSGIAILTGVTSTFAANSLADTSRNLVSYNSQEASGTLSFTSDMMYSKFCNNVSQGYTYGTDKIIGKGNGISTMMYCEGLPMTLEDNFKISISGTSAVIKNDQLIITTSQNNIFTFKKEISDPVMCTMEYAPVCGEVDVQCIKAPCPPIKQTFGNACTAGAAKAKNITQGECSTPPVVGGDIDEHGCKASAGYSWNADNKECVRSWEYDSVLWAYKNGITKYNTMTTFRADDYVTREQAAKMLMTTIDKSGVKEWMIKQTAGSCERKDAKSIDPILYDQAFRSCTKGLFKGTNEGTFLPHQAITKEQMSILLKRLEVFIPKVGKHSYIADETTATPYTRLEFVQTLQQLAQVLERAATQDFTKQSADLKAAQELWISKNITNYKMIQQRSCFCMEDYTRPMIYDVTNNKTQKDTATYNDKDKEKIPSSMEVQLNNVTDAFKIIEAAIADNVDSLTVEYDKTYGYPTKISIDYNFMIADEEQYLSFTMVK